MSITLVLFSHLDGTVGFPVWLREFEDFGNLGVRVFFVISGFLITTLLLNEQSDHGLISLTGFYRRRCFRIFPACYAFLIIIGLLNWSGRIQLLPYDLLYGAAYLMNNHVQHSWYVGHLWSLSVEEQFYLLWPAFLCFAGLRASIRAALVMLLTAPLFRIAILFLLPGYRPLIGTFFPTIADALATGCLLAFFGRDLNRNRHYRAFLGSWPFYLAPLAVLLLNYTTSVTLSMLFGQSLLNLTIALCIHRYVLLPYGYIGRMLNSKPLSALGVLSYSLYLWQQPFLNRHSTGLISSFPTNIILAVGAATISYWLVERPFLRISHRLNQHKAMFHRAGSIIRSVRDVSSLGG